MNYTERHIKFLQKIMEESVISERKAKELSILIFNHADEVTEIALINKQLDIVKMMIKRVTCDITGKKYWVFGNTISNNSIRFDQIFSRAKSDFIQKILMEIVLSQECFKSSTELLNLCSKLGTKLPIVEAQNILDYLVAEKWLVLKEGQYYIGVRSKGQLMPYFKTLFGENEINSCFLCRQEIFYGSKCDSCQTLFHISCLNSTRSQKNVQCPNCNKKIILDDIRG